MQVAEIPFPIQSADQVAQAIERYLTDKTRLLLIDHVTSPTGLVFPVNDIIKIAHRRNVRVIVDGAHAPGMVPVDLRQINADYYTANHHKWLCAPKTSGFLYVAPQWQPEVRPTTISHGANTESYGKSRFLAEFNWIGTYDPTPILSVPTAIDFLNRLGPGGITELCLANRSLVLAGREKLLNALEIESPAPPAMIGSLASIPIATQDRRAFSDATTLQRRLYDEYRIEVPVFKLNDQLHCLRISAQAYNVIEQYERLAIALRNELK